MLELVVLDGSGQRYALTEGAEVRVGTAAQCQVRLRAEDVSRSHALIACRQGKVFLLDLGSRNGTFVNGRRTKEAELGPGDLVRFSTVVAQIVPSEEQGTEGSETDSAQRSRGGEGEPPLAATSEGIPVNLQRSLIDLIGRWGMSEGGAVAALLEWIVGQRGMAGAVVLDTIGGETVVSAAHGAVDRLLESRRCTGLLLGQEQPRATVETLQYVDDGEPVLAVAGPGGPCLVLKPRETMPDTEEIELWVRLLTVAGRLDRCPTGSPTGRKA